MLAAMTIDDIVVHGSDSENEGVAEGELKSFMSPISFTCPTSSISFLSLINLNHPGSSLVVCVRLLACVDSWKQKY